MKLQYLGTGAAEGVPGMFCHCRVCENARKVGGREIRTRSQALLDDRLLIDFPADTNWHIHKYGIDLQAIPALLVTHAHTDHFYPADFECRSPGMAILPEGLPRLQIYGSAAVLKKYEAVVYPGWQVDLHELRAYEPVRILDYTVTPLPANHDPGSGPFIYIIEGDKTLLYGNDTGLPCDAVFDYIAEKKVRFDALSLDCTGILHTWLDHHCGLPADHLFFGRLLAAGAVQKDTPVYLNHFSHNGGLTYAELTDLLANRPMWSSTYDGRIVEV